MIQYCSVAMNSMLSRSGRRGSGAKFWHGNMSKLSDAVKYISKRDSVGLMNTLIKWNCEEGRLTWLYLESLPG